MSTISKGTSADEPDPGTDDWVEANEGWLEEVAESDRQDAWVAKRVLENYRSSDEDEEGGAT